MSGKFCKFMLSAGVAIAIAGAVACSSGPSPRAARAAAELDPCSLLPPAAVAAAIHAPAVAAERQDSTHCLYREVGPSYNVLIVEASRTGADSEFEGLGLGNQILASVAGMSVTKPAPKVGDASVMWSMGMMFTARKGDGWVTIDMRGANCRPATTGPALARQALARL